MAAIEPDLPIIDPHHHLWMLPESAVRDLEATDSALARAMSPSVRAHPRYMFEELTADLASGHNVVATVAVEAHRMHRAAGPDHLKPCGEIEFINGVAAIGASGLFGETRICEGIVGGGIDLRSGDSVELALAAQEAAAGGRLRGIRCMGTVNDGDGRLLGPANGLPRVMYDPAFREGFGRLAPRGLSADIWILEPQIPELTDLARAFPETTIVLNHAGSPTALPGPGGGLAERFSVWRGAMRELACCPNVMVKLGGLANPLRGFETGPVPVASTVLAGLWKPYIETCIELFGPDRCMFESNFPIDSATCNYGTLWNAFKLSVSAASPAEKQALFHDTAKRTYRLGSRE